jgi:adenylosuccinate synthase
MKSKNIIIVQGLLGGDEAKGATVDFLSSIYNFDYGMRFGGGAQCAHNVVVEGKRHCFSQLSAASLNRAATVLMKDVVVNPITLWREKEIFRDNFGFNPIYFVDPDCLVTTPFHQLKNRLTEKRLKHGSCGMGIWATKEYAMKYPTSALRFRDIEDRSVFKTKCKIIRDNILLELIGSLGTVEEIYRDKELTRLVSDDDFIVEFRQECHQPWFSGLAPFYEHIRAQNLIFEGHQGVLLDENHGYMPYVSGSGDCTSKAAEDFLAGQEYEIVGTIRPYMTRHGHGPFESERKINGTVDDYNLTGEFQGPFRVGLFNLTELRRVLSVQRVDSLSISCLDNDPFDVYLEEGKEVPFKSKKGLDRAKEISDLLEKPLKCVAFGPERKDRKLV